MVTQHCTEALKHGLKVQTWKSHVYVHTSFTIEWENSIMAQNSFPGLVTLLLLQICPLYSPQMLLFLTPSNIWIWLKNICKNDGETGGECKYAQV